MALQKTTDRVRGSCALPRSGNGPRAGGAAPACMYNRVATCQVAEPGTLAALADGHLDRAAVDLTAARAARIGPSDANLTARRERRPRVEVAVRIGEDHPLDRLERAPRRRLPLHLGDLRRARVHVANRPHAAPDLERLPRLAGL